MTTPRSPSLNSDDHHEVGQPFQGNLLNAPALPRVGEETQVQYSRFAARAVYRHRSAGQPLLPRLRHEAAAVPVSRLSGLVLHVRDESAATTVQLVDSFMPLAAPLVSGD